MNRDTQLATEDLGKVIDYLEGLEIILKTFDAEGRGRAGGDHLVQALSDLDGLDVTWAPIRYQEDSGMGWGFLLENVRGLRDRLVERYGSAAL